MEPTTINIKDMSVADRPREKLIKNGAKELTNTELIAIILGSGSHAIPLMTVCKSLIDATNDDMHQLSQLDINALNGIKGIGPVKAVAITAAIELGKRSLTEKPPLILKDDAAVEKLIRNYLTDVKIPEYHLVMLNGRSELLASSRLRNQKGKLPDIKKIIKLSLETGAAEFILCRNDIKIPAKQTDQEKAYIIQLDAAACMFRFKMRGLLVITRQPKRESS